MMYSIMIHYGEDMIKTYVNLEKLQEQSTISNCPILTYFVPDKNKFNVGQCCLIDNHIYLTASDERIDDIVIEGTTICRDNMIIIISGGIGIGRT